MAHHLLIRADASVRMGSGHLMRCLALAQAWRARGGSVTFLSHCENTRLRSRIEAAGHDFLPLEIPHPDPLDLRTTLSVLDGSGIEAPQAATDWLVLDGYHFDSSYQQAVRA